MAVGGALPKEDRSQVRHRMAVLDWTDVADVPFEGHLLPQRWVTRKGHEPVRADWPHATTRWWGVIRRMPHTKLWSPADWEYAFATAEIHARFSEGGAGATELRIREGNMGVTMEDRRKLRIRYITPSQAAKNEAKAAAKDAAPAAGGNVIDLSLYGGPAS